ncbi:MAG: PIG-L family deacetylase [Lentisphaerae bacterium]|nr:PIG-L family deacetylase [Lentisphaerota bacterium]
MTADSGNGTILVLAPHTDDGELGCGGAIARFIEAGRAVHYAAFSTARASVRPEFPDDVLEAEVRNATEILGIQPDHLHIYDFPVRHFPGRRQDILQTLVDLRRAVSPEVIFVPSPTDVHQDHQVIASEGLRAFKSHTILGYEEPWNNVEFATRCFIPLEERHLETKVRALEAYKSQDHRHYLRPELIRGLARVRGAQFERTYAEAFEVLRWIWA